MHLRILHVESEPEDVLFIQDVLTEIESGQYWSNWVPIETLHASGWDDATIILAHELIDIVLLGLDPTDNQGVDTFHHLQATAPHIPIVLLFGPDDESLAVRMVRNGAQDFLSKRQVDCAPLAHAIRSAIERHRLLTAARAGTITDSLTGLPNRGGFLAFADRDRKLAERLDRRLMVLVAEPNNIGEAASTHDRQRRDLMLVEAAEHLRSLAGPTDLVARIGETRFAVAVIDSEAESVEEVWARMYSAAAGFHIQIGAAIFDGDRPFSLDTLLERAACDLAPRVSAVRT